MFIKQILVYDYSYAEYIVSDNINDVICMCLSVPLPNNKLPMVNMEVMMIYAFSISGDIEIKRIENAQDRNIKILRGSSYFEYILRARVLDAKKSLVSLYGLIISLEYCYPDGLPKDILNGDYIQFHADRLDCELIV